MDDAVKPVLKVFRDAKSGKLQIKLPKKGARWQGRFDNIDAAVKVALEEVDPPFVIDYVTEEEKDA